MDDEQIRLMSSGQFLEWALALIRRGPSPERDELVRIISIAQIARRLKKRATLLRNFDGEKSLH
jgi:hypothetical protein